MDQAANPLGFEEAWSATALRCDIKQIDAMLDISDRKKQGVLGPVQFVCNRSPNFAGEAAYA